MKITLTSWLSFCRWSWCGLIFLKGIREYRRVASAIGSKGTEYVLEGYGKWHSQLLSTQEEDPKLSSWCSWNKEDTGFNFAFTLSSCMLWQLVLKFIWGRILSGCWVGLSNFAYSLQLWKPKIRKGSMSSVLLSPCFCPAFSCLPTGVPGKQGTESHLVGFVSLEKSA